MSIFWFDIGMASRYVVSCKWFFVAACWPRRAALFGFGMIFLFGIIFDSP